MSRLNTDTGTDYFKLSFGIEDDEFLEKLSTISLDSLIQTQNLTDELWLQISRQILSFLGEGETIEDRR
jgi:hypothetical protein